MGCQFRPLRKFRPARARLPSLALGKFRFKGIPAPGLTSPSIRWIVVCLASRAGLRMPGARAQDFRSSVAQCANRPISMALSQLPGFDLFFKEARGARPWPPPYSKGLLCSSGGTPFMGPSLVG